MWEQISKEQYDAGIKYGLRSVTTPGEEMIFTIYFDDDSGTIHYQSRTPYGGETFYFRNSKITQGAK